MAAVSAVLNQRSFSTWCIVIVVKGGLARITITAWNSPSTSLASPWIKNSPISNSVTYNLPFKVTALMKTDPKGENFNRRTSMAVVEVRLRGKVIQVTKRFRREGRTVRLRGFLPVRRRGYGCCESL